MLFTIKVQFTNILSASMPFIVLVGTEVLATSIAVSYNYNEHQKSDERQILLAIKHPAYKMLCPLQLTFIVILLYTKIYTSTSFMLNMVSNRDILYNWMSIVQLILNMDLFSFQCCIQL